MRDVIAGLNHFIDYADKTRKYADAGFYEDCKTEIKQLRERLAETASVPDICWDYDNQEDGVDPDEMAPRLADNLQPGESEVFAVSCAKMLPNMVMRVSVSCDGDVTWTWDAEEEEATMFLLIAEIRAAAGDAEGRLMQDELVTRIRALRILAEEE